MIIDAELPLSIALEASPGLYGGGQSRAFYYKN
jgi:hypothetical protein